MSTGFPIAAAAAITLAVVASNADEDAVMDTGDWQPTNHLRWWRGGVWGGRILEQLWLASDGSKEWREVEEVAD